MNEDPKNPGGVYKLTGADRERLREVFRNLKPVMLFPEGTTSPGKAILPGPVSGPKNAGSHFEPPAEGVLFLMPSRRTPGVLDTVFSLIHDWERAFGKDVKPLTLTLNNSDIRDERTAGLYDVGRRKPK